MLLLIFIIPHFLNVSTCLCYDYSQDANCVGAWLFTEGSGTTVADSSGEGNTGNFKGDGEPAWASMAGEGAPTYCDYMVNNDGIDDYIVVEYNSSIEQAFITGGTVVLWVNPDNDGESDKGNMVREETNVWGFHVVGQSGNLMKLQWFTKFSGGWGNWISTNTVLEITKWQHLACVYSSASDENDPTFWLNGSSIDITESSAPSGNAAWDNSSFYIGNNTNLTETFDGYYTEVALFNRILSSVEINDIMDNGLAGSGVVASIFQPILNIF